MITYEAKVYAGKIFVGFVQAKTLPTLKRMASVRCNRHHAAVDSMFVHKIADGVEYNGVHMYRMNIKTPDSVIVRGFWR